MKLLRDDELPLEPLARRRIAVIGFGAQGRAHALNLRDSGCAVTVGLRRGSPSWAAAGQAGLTVREIAPAAGAADVVMLLVPDDVQPEVFARDIGPSLRPGAYLGFAHGYAIHYRRIVPAGDVNVFLAAPYGVGQLVRRQYQAGRGVPCAVAVHQDPGGDTRAVALAYARALGCGRAGVLETTFREETETDLFAEQAVLCGGLAALVTAGFETLVQAGYAPEMAYFACLHEVKLIADLVHERGLAGMRAAISTTARYGDLTRGPRIIGAAARQAMREVLEEIRTGAFAAEWDAEAVAGGPRLAALTARAAQQPIEAVGARLRALLPWLAAADPPEPAR